MLRESQATLQDFLERQKNLLEITFTLSSAKSIDELCRLAVELGKTHLGFDRLGIFLIDTSQAKAVGAYGTDTQGNVRLEKHITFDFSSEPWVREWIERKTRIIVDKDADLYEGKDVIGHGWNVRVGLWQEDTAIGLLFFDNLVEQRPLQSFEPELMAAYGSAISNIIIRNRTEIELGTRETLLRTIIDSTPDWMFVKDVEHRYQMVNQGYADAIQIAPKTSLAKMTWRSASPKRLSRAIPKRAFAASGPMTWRSWNAVS